jgi:hypothetical protein
MDFRPLIRYSRIRSSASSDTRCIGKTKTNFLSGHGNVGKKGLSSQRAVCGHRFEPLSHKLSYRYRRGDSKTTRCAMSKG